MRRHRELARGQHSKTTLAAKDGPHKAELKPLQEELRKIDSKQVDGKFLGPAGISKDVRGTGPIYGTPDVFDFAPGSVILSNLWHWPDANSFTVSSPGHPNTLHIQPSPVTDTLFEFSFDVTFAPTNLNEEAGATNATPL
ncbi:hypothetical protein K438DRAFT_1973817 [Mycena galopus ATCC 62051]|nr:hypothetical protein K438DRAFT_1973817 [Mycena galopus ATCC 62051]